MRDSVVPSVVLCIYFLLLPDAAQLKKLLAPASSSYPRRLVSTQVFVLISLEAGQPINSTISIASTIFYCVFFRFNRIYIIKTQNQNFFLLHWEFER